jgi:hypothetical protein
MNARLIKLSLIVTLSLGSVCNAVARPNANAGTPRGAAAGPGLRGTAALCDQASATIDLDINNVRALLMNGGDMWWDRGSGTARYEVPKGSGKNALYAGSIWVGGYDEQENLKVCAQTYRQGGGNDYWPGPLDLQTASIEKAQCSEWDKFWKINKSDLLAFNELIKSGVEVSVDNQIYRDIIQWPAAGNEDALGKSGTQLSFLQNKRGSDTYAPFVDANGNGIYEWRRGDYPAILGDQFVWWVFNDAGAVKTETETGAIGMEIQTSAFAFSTKNYLNDATFINYRLINRGNLDLRRTYMATWTDADLGYAYDDYIGCDTARSLGILYNAKTPDGTGDVTHYGNQIPMVGVDFFIGPKLDTIIDDVYQIRDTLGMTVFNYFNNGTGPTGNPNGGVEIYRLMTGFNRIGNPIQNDQSLGSGSTGFGPGNATPFVYPGNPNNPAEWSQCQCRVPYDIIPDGDRRFIHSSGPFTLYSGGIVNDITIGAVWVSDVGGCGTGTFARIRAADDLAQRLFNDKFRALEGPHAPDMTIREGDREFIVYLTNNNPASNNYKEKYGRDTAARYRESTAQTRQYPDSLYKFEGYRVFQLKNSSITAAQIFGENGEINGDVAAEVFQTDIRNGVSKIINYTRDPEAGANIYSHATKVEGKDSGLVHSFKITNDLFARGSDSRIVNYKTYYYIAIAYAYNNFRTFNYALGEDSTQVSPYLESTKGPGGINNPIIAAVANPTNGAMGTVAGAGYGDGVDIQQVEGLGNGRFAIQMNAESETEALKDPNYKVNNPVYQAGNTPIEVKVVDPRKLQQMDFEVWLNGPVVDGIKGIEDSAGSWTLRDKTTGEVLYTESGLAERKDIILADYGLSIVVQQGRHPGEDQVDRNGFITASVSFAEPGKLWLAGVNDADDNTPRNWIRSGQVNDSRDTTVLSCSVRNNALDSAGSFYEQLFAGNDLLRGTWAPYALASQANTSICGFGIARNNTTLTNLQSVDIVFTSDKSKWTRSPVVEMQDDPNLAENRGIKYRLRRHQGWNLDIDGNGNPVYSNNPADSGISWFPGYAVSQTTGERLNIVFGEDSYLKNDRGNDMIWNPTSSVLDVGGGVLFGGKHYVYVLNSKYDAGKTFIDSVRDFGGGVVPQFTRAYQRMMWVGVPLLNRGFNFLSLNNGLIPTETRLKIRVEGPYRRQADTTTVAVRNGGLPIFGFSTRGIAPKPLTNAGNPYHGDKQALLDRIRAVPNPYYGYTGYERNRLDTRIKITNLPNRATISIYSLDGTLIRRLEHVKTEATTQGFEEWDIRNAKGLQIASGMYLIHVKAEGIGETVIKWFGSMRPTDITTY